MIGLSEPIWSEMVYLLVWQNWHFGRKMIGKDSLYPTSLKIILFFMVNPLNWALGRIKLFIPLHKIQIPPQGNLLILASHCNWPSVLRVISLVGIEPRTGIGTVSFASPLIRPRPQRHCFRSTASHPSGLDIQKSSWAMQGIKLFATAKKWILGKSKQSNWELFILMKCLIQLMRLRITNQPCKFLQKI